MSGRRIRVSRFLSNGAPGSTRLRGVLRRCTGLVRKCVRRARRDLPSRLTRFALRLGDGDSFFW
jgi:hypothetical protein